MNNPDHSERARQWNAYGETLDVVRATIEQDLKTYTPEELVLSLISQAQEEAWTQPTEARQTLNRVKYVLRNYCQVPPVERID
jgi:hypothetical protein